MRQVTQDQAIELIRKESHVVVLLEKTDEPLCKRARQSFRVHGIKLEQMGYKMCSVEVSSNSKYKELACLRIPQTRVFVDEELVAREVGIPSEQFIANLLTENFE